MKALITGITGQDGCFLTQLLLSKRYEVYGVVRRNSAENLGTLQLLPEELAEAVRLTLRDRDDILKSYGGLGRRFDVGRFVRKFGCALAGAAGYGG